MIEKNYSNIYITNTFTEIYMTNIQCIESKSVPETTAYSWWNWFSPIDHHLTLTVLRDIVSVTNPSVVMTPHSPKMMTIVPAAED